MLVLSSTTLSSPYGTARSANGTRFCGSESRLLMLSPRAWRTSRRRQHKRRRYSTSWWSRRPSCGEARPRRRMILPTRAPGTPAYALSRWPTSTTSRSQRKILKTDKRRRDPRPVRDARHPTTAVRTKRQFSFVIMQRTAPHVIRTSCRYIVRHYRETHRTIK